MYIMHKTCQQYLTHYTKGQFMRWEHGFIVIFFLIQTKIQLSWLTYVEDRRIWVGMIYTFKIQYYVYNYIHNLTDL